jgi:predicted aspartyl protease
MLACQEDDMGEVRAEITLVNIGGQEVADRGYIPRDQVRRVTVNAVADTGAWTLVINEKIRDALGLRVEIPTQSTVAGGGKVASGITEPVRIHWEDRRTTCEAVCIPGEEEALMGAIPLEGMDLIVHPLENKVTGKHGTKFLSVIK